MNLRQKMKRGPVFGFAIFTGASSVIESVGNWGYDFVYLDVEHTSIGVGPILSVRSWRLAFAGVASVVRLTGTNEVDIRKTSEMGLDGAGDSTCPHRKTRPKKSSGRPSSRRKDGAVPNRTSGPLRLGTLKKSTTVTSIPLPWRNSHMIHDCLGRC